eukprot:SAG22_NODE_14012_length_388_cov_0.429066_1_plen_37_part_10
MKSSMVVSLHALASITMLSLGHSSPLVNDPAIIAAIN